MSGVYFGQMSGGPTNVIVKMQSFIVSVPAMKDGKLVYDVDLIPKYSVTATATPSLPKPTDDDTPTPEETGTQTTPPPDEEPSAETSPETESIRKA